MEPEQEQRVQTPVHPSALADLRPARPRLEAPPVRESSDPISEDLEVADPRDMAVRQLLVGVMLVVVGVVVTAATYSAARHDGDRYFLAFGPIVVGAIAMVRGVLGLVRS
jgi:hypothetical protein